MTTKQEQLTCFDEEEVCWHDLVDRKIADVVCADDYPTLFKTQKIVKAFTDENDVLHVFTKKGDTAMFQRIYVDVMKERWGTGGWVLGGLLSNGLRLLAKPLENNTFAALSGLKKKEE